MREIQASDAKARLPELLDEVEGGETLIVTRRGRAIARIVPEVNRRQEEVDRALTSIRNSCSIHSPDFFTWPALHLFAAPPILIDKAQGG